MNNREKLNSEEVVCDGKTITIRVLRTGDQDVDEERETEAVKRRYAEISDMLASPHLLTSEEQKQLEAGLGVLESFISRCADHPGEKGLIPPGWSSAADLLFHNGLKEARENAKKECDKSLRERFLFQFLVRFCATFPECKQDLWPDVARAYRDGPAHMLAVATTKRPLCNRETLRFLRAYLEGGDPLWKLSLSECARRMDWFTYQRKPDRKRVRDTLKEYGIAHGVKGKPGRPKK